VSLQLVELSAVPFNVMVFDPCVKPKLAPMIVTEVPIDPDAGEIPTIPAEVSVKARPLLLIFDTVTTILPVVPLGTGATIWVLLHVVGVVVIPLNVTVLDPCIEPKFVPVIVTGVPTEPEVGDRLARIGATVLVPRL
jgi:hypothetical protein